jgi:hypothetical protein
MAAQPMWAGRAEAATLEVCMSGCPFTQIAPALAAAKDGDTISVGPGTYAGGLNIDVSVKLVGAGSGLTVIRGGGPVVTIGLLNAAREPTVSIDGVTITGGVNTSSPFAYVAVGGGLDVPNGANSGPGATVVIGDSVVTGNVVAPSTATDSGIPCPPDITITCINGDLPFAAARGGGIATTGKMTLNRTTVRDNRAGSSVASDVEGAGVFGFSGSSLVLNNSTVAGNRASAVAPNGRFADSGGIFAFGALRINHSVVRANRANLSASMPSDVITGTLAIAGGIHVGSSGSAQVNDSTISDNSVVMTNSVGDATAFSGGLHTDVNFQLTGVVVADNTVTVQTLAGSSGNASGDSGAGEMSGTIRNSRMTGNTVKVSSAKGRASAAAGASIFAGSMTSTVLRANHVQASSPSGAVSAIGGGLMVADMTTLRDTKVTDNTASGSGQSGTVQGGGIFDAPVPNGPPAGPLTLTNSTIAGNGLNGTANITLQGGGLYIANEPVTLTNSFIVNNVPDQCFGC